MILDDFSHRNSINKSCIVCSTGRSGSNLLCKTLAETNILGYAREYFHEDTLEKYIDGNHNSELYDYITQVYEQGTSPNHCFNVKLHWHQYRALIKLSRKVFDDLQGKTDFEVLGSLFPNPYYIYIRRSDVLRQAISTVIAYQSGVWIATGDKQLRDLQASDLRFQPVKIYRYKVALEKHNAAWRKAFARHNQTFYELIYEELIESFPEKMAEIFSFLDADPPDSLVMPTKKLANETNEQWHRYYSAIPEILIQILAEKRTKLREALEQFGN
ncbi:MAG: Stf0 family sulfotransferase [Cyanobacteria bacterium P01_F01_bin.86]